MVRALFFKWPHLKKQLSLEDDALTLRKEKLRTYFKNSRKWAPDIPKIMVKKKWKLYNNDKHQEKVKVYRSCGKPNFLPVFPDGEDEETMKDHSERLRQKSRISKEKRDTAAINNLMVITFSHWRHLLITDIEKLSKVIDLYPILCDEEQVCCKCKTWDCVVHIAGMFYIFLYNNEIC